MCGKQVALRGGHWHAAVDAASLSISNFNYGIDVCDSPHNTSPRSSGKLQQISARVTGRRLGAGAYTGPDETLTCSPPASRIRESVSVPQALGKCGKSRGQVTKARSINIAASQCYTHSPLLAQAARTAGQHSVDEKLCDEWRRQRTPSSCNEAGHISLAFGYASGSAVGTAKNYFGVATTGRQPTLGCEGPRLLKASQTVQIPLLNSRCRSSIEVIKIEQSSTAIMAHKLCLRLRPQLSL